MDIKKKNTVWAGKPRKDFFGSTIKNGDNVIKYHLNNPNSNNTTIFVSKEATAKRGSKDFNKLHNLK